jgi:kynurenine formamidase
MGRGNGIVGARRLQPSDERSRSSAIRVEVNVTRHSSVAIGLVIVAVVAFGSRDRRAGAAQAQGSTATQAPASRPVNAPDPLTQAPEHLVTPEQMKKWEKELSNWGRWGKDDERGTLNLITPEKTKSALRLVKDAVSVALHKYPDLTKQIDSWSFGETVHRMTNIDPKTGQPTFALDYIALGTHDGTSAHLDALCHYPVQSGEPGKPPLVYNGHPQNLTLKGCEADGMDRMGPGYITRGILVDMPLMKGVEWLPEKTPIFASDLEAWEKFANVKIGSGDALFIRTGRYARRAKTGPWNAAQTTAGLHASVLPWLHQRDIAILGGDSVPDAQPSGVQGWPRPIHDILIPIMGTPLVDNGYYEDLAKEAAQRTRWEFMVSWAVLRIPGGTASPFTALATF